MDDKAYAVREKCGEPIGGFFLAMAFLLSTAVVAFRPVDPAWSVQGLWLFAVGLTLVGVFSCGVWWFERLCMGLLPAYRKKTSPSQKFVPLVNARWLAIRLRDIGISVFGHNFLDPKSGRGIWATILFIMMMIIVVGSGIALSFGERMLAWWGIAILIAANIPTFMLSRKNRKSVEFTQLALMATWFAATFPCMLAMLLIRRDTPFAILYPYIWFALAPAYIVNKTLKQLEQTDFIPAMPDSKRIDAVEP